jgi:hypothetical protein
VSRLVTRFSNWFSRVRFLAPYRRAVVMGVSERLFARGMVRARYGSTRSPGLYGPRGCGG